LDAGQPPGGFSLRAGRKRHWNHRHRDPADLLPDVEQEAASGAQPARRPPFGLRTEPDWRAGHLDLGYGSLGSPRRHCKNSDVTGTILGNMAFTGAGLSTAKDVAEFTGGIRAPVWKNGAVTASVTTSRAPNQTTTYVSRVSISQAF
jgi:hypothetical protein